MRHLPLEKSSLKKDRRTEEDDAVAGEEVVAADEIFAAAAAAGHWAKRVNRWPLLLLLLLQLLLRWLSFDRCDGGEIALMRKIKGRGSNSEKYQSIVGIRKKPKKPGF